MIYFMYLMRTEFFETLNPRGRKLTTRLQERWPLDQEQDKHETAKIMRRLHTGEYGGKTEKEREKLKKEKRERFVISKCHHRLFLRFSLMLQSLRSL